MVGGAVSRLRSLMFNLRPTGLDHGDLLGPLRDRLEQVQRDELIEYSLAGSEPGALTTEVRVTLYRIAQEAISNVVKHASARHIDVAVSEQDGGCLIRIADDGAGLGRGARGAPRSPRPAQHARAERACRRLAPVGGGRSRRHRGHRLGAGTVRGAAARDGHRECRRLSTRVMIADDDANIRDALRELLESEAGIEVVAVARDATEAVEAAAQQHPDVAILDVKMPGGGGPRAARGILAESPGTRIVALSAYGDRASILEMLSAGASAYLVKGSMPDEVTQTIQRVLRGESAFSPDVASTVVRELSEQLAGKEEAEARRARVLARIQAVIEHGGIHPVYQPIVDLVKGRVTGVEALSRFDTGMPLQWFEEAADVGLREELEASALAVALAGLPALPPDAYLSLNLSPSTLLRRDVARLLGAVPLERIVIEMTEHAPVGDYEALNRALQPLRHGGRPGGRG